MKKTKYIVEFRFGVKGEGPLVEVMAYSREQAAILAQAQRIERGLDYQIDRVWESTKQTGV